MIFGQKIRNRKYQNGSLSNAFLVAHADCEPLQRIGFLGHFLNEIGNSMSTKTSWGLARHGSFHEPRDRLYWLFAADRGMESAESEVYTCCPLVERSCCC